MNFVGVDIGGTSVKVGIVSADGKMLSRGQQDIEDRSPEAIVDLGVALAKQCATESNLEWSEISGLGVGCPGQVANGVLVAAANFTTWDHVPLELMFHERLHIPSILVNDADAAVAAEHWIGAAASVKNFVMISTGVGFGVVNDNKIIAGGTGMIEGGHIIVVPNGRQCGCTQKGCLERYSSASAVIEQAQLKASDPALTTLLSNKKPTDITAKDVFDAANAGDLVAKEIIHEVADYLGLASVNFCRILDPEMIVLSGGLAEAGEPFVQQIRDAYFRYTWSKLPNPVIIEKASVGYDSGIIGAAAFAYKANIGGTSVKCGVVNSEGVLISRSQQKIEEDRSAEVVVDLCVSLVQKCVTESGLPWSQIAGLGVGCPGQIDHGVLAAAANFESWKNVPLERLLHEKLSIPSILVNDADAAVAAEHWVGAASNVKNFVMLTLGTGIGFGVVNADAILAGGTGMIEGGHLIVVPNGRQCGCTQRGCLERYSSATALIQQAKLRASDNTSNTSLSELTVDEITAKDVFDAAAAGDAVSRELIAEAADYLGLACVNFCRVLDPELIVLSGGLAENGEQFIQDIRDAYKKYTWTKLPNPVRIEKASVGYNSGILGAAAFAYKRDITN